jgi:D-hexose-6-phosphate mutarotase
MSVKLKNNLNDQRIMKLEELNAGFGIKNQLEFVEDASGILLLKVDNTLASASICLQGAHLQSWHPRSTSVPVVWFPENVPLQQGKSVHGGVPICWPWFGAHATEHDFPAHGFARVAPWQLIERAEEPNGATRLVLQMQDSPLKQQYGPQACDLTLTIIIGDQLSMQLATKNTGNEAFVFSEAMHTYFQISDIEKIRVSGLEGGIYLDKVGEAASRTQDGDISFAGETDRIYINTTAPCVIEDSGLQRRIQITKKGSDSTVVWSPWTEKARIDCLI